MWPGRPLYGWNSRAGDQRRRRLSSKSPPTELQQLWGLEESPPHLISKALQKYVTRDGPPDIEVPERYLSNHTRTQPAPSAYLLLEPLGLPSIALIWIQSENKRNQGVRSAGCYAVPGTQETNPSPNTEESTRA